MAECVASPLFVKLHVQKSYVKGRDFASQNSHFRMFKRNYSSGSSKLLQFSMWKTSDRNALRPPHVKNIYGIAMNCACLGSLVDPDGAAASDLVSVVDQVLLMASICLTYMAGVIPVTKTYPTYQKIISDETVVPESSNISGSAVNNNEQIDSKYALDVVKRKLLDSLNAFEYGANSGITFPDFGKQDAKRPLSLNAIAEGPRLRLLWASFMQVEEKVNNISSISVNGVVDDWLTMFSEVVQNSLQPICMDWLEKELCLENSNEDKELASLIFEKLKDDSIVVQSIQKSGKEDLYAEFLCFLSVGSLRDGCSYGNSLFVLHGISILEDLVITLADGVASMYLELISVDSNVLSELNSLDLALCTLSTREVQRLRNKVALNQWLYQNLDTVVSMYEDRFDLRTLQKQLIDVPSNSRTQNHNWWKRFTLRKSETVSHQLHHIVISDFSIPVKRTKELRSLTGWQYYYSLFLELSDITTPLIRAVIDKVSNAISFFLVSLIGRSLGLIYTGIRQALQWK
ncbi:Phosphoglycolate phosphatase [Quillaja saponaria]|uniref:Phosphoglycolate phosphatase n=1 Tax=Quillaja saponaria TaxID=32244 RepID=A0AAD7PCF4_QUISA|nr:Phosphoglycolate phosphatase [Quillaja saponaria]